MSAQTPKISVVMSVYNAQNDLQESIESILGQTFKDFEFIIINDGSRDDSLSVIKAYAEKDPRIHIIDQENKGLTKALNVGVKAARGAYIARQDADDISYPHRFETQIRLFESNPSIVLAGGNCDDIYEDGHKGVWGFHDPEKLQRIVFLKTPFAHSTAMMRADICRELGGYDESYRTAQDMELWMRFAGKGKLAMAQEPILARRIVSGSISAKRRWRQFYDALRARWTHNRGLARFHALYQGVRGLIIGLMPPRVTRFLKDMKT